MSETITAAADAATDEGVSDMTEENKIEVLLSRDSDETISIYKAAGIELDAPVMELARRFESLNAELSQKETELKKYQEAELSRVAAEKAAEVEEFLNAHDVNEVERELFKVNLLSEDVKTVELARKTIIARGEPDKLSGVEEALTEAKKRGAVPADFTVDGELAELSRTAPDVAVGIINAIPGENTVRVGEPAGSDVAGLAQENGISKEEAGLELSKLARKMVQSGEASSVFQAHNMVKSSRPDLTAILNG